MESFLTYILLFSKIKLSTTVLEYGNMVRALT